MAEVVKLMTRKELKEEGFQNYLKNITEDIKANNITTILSILYDKEGDAYIMMAGDYKQDREILGDLELLKQAVHDGEI